MSFASDCKAECTRQTDARACCFISELCGLYCACGSLSLLGGGRFNIQFISESMAVGRRVFILLQKALRLTPQLHYVTHARFGGRRSCVLTLGPVETPRLLLAFGMAQPTESGGIAFRSAAPRLPLTRQCCRKAFLRGLFVGCGTVSPPGKEYHLELKTRDAAAQELAARALQGLELPVHISRRQKGECFYLKQCDQIVTLLSAIGAHQSVLQLEEARLRRQVYSTAARMVNCDEANLHRQLNAAEKQIDSIAAYRDRNGLSGLPPALRDVALARLENPEANLSQLGERMNPPLTKSAVNNRLRRLMAFLDTEKEGQAEEQAQADKAQEIDTENGSASR